METSATVKWICVVVFFAPGGHVMRFEMPIAGARNSAECLDEGLRIARKYPSPAEPRPRGLGWEWLASCYRPEELQPPPEVLVAR
jgi:hypothetical protein